MRVLLRALGNVLRLLLAPLWLSGRALALRRVRWVRVRLSPRVSQFRAPSTWLRRLASRSKQPALHSLEALEALARTLATDRNVVGLLIELPAVEAAWATCESLRDVFAYLRRSGKQVVCYLPEGGGNRELFVALAADRAYMMPFSAFGPLGLAAEPLYVRPLLDRLGMTVEAQACGEYKSAAEPALRDTMSAPAREQLEALLWSRHRALSAALRTRGFGDDQIGAFIREGLVPAASAVRSGVVDGLAYADELTQRLGLAPEASGNDSPKKKATRAAALTDADRYQRLRSGKLWRPLRRAPTIAVLSLRGTIAGDHGGVSRNVIRPSRVAKALRGFADDEHVAAVVLHIDSPGGSALASEQIHREVARLDKVKPVVACFGDVAASGGYYIACACRRIVAQPQTITGSIGVISAKLSAGALLSRLGIHPQLVSTAERANLMSFAHALSAEDAALLQAHAEELYQRFLEVVALGRGRAREAVEPFARGRVWAGQDAHAHGLVDVLGGMPRALDEARALLVDLPERVRSALQPSMYLLQPDAGLTLADLGARALGAAGPGIAPGTQFDAAQLEAGLDALGLGALSDWLRELPELACLGLLRGETGLYYAPGLLPFAR